MFKRSLLSLVLCGLVTGSVICDQVNFTSRDEQIAEQLDIVSNATTSEMVLSGLFAASSGITFGLLLYDTVKFIGFFKFISEPIPATRTLLCGATSLCALWNVFKIGQKVNAFKKIKEILLQQDKSCDTADDSVCEAVVTK